MFVFQLGNDNRSASEEEISEESESEKLPDNMEQLKMANSQNGVISSRVFSRKSS